MCAPSSPDTSKQDAIAAQAQHLTEEQFNWVKDQYAAEAPNRQAASDMARQVSQEELAQMHKSGALADESAANYRRIYQPQEERAARDANSFDSEANQAAAAGRAVGDVRTQGAIQRGASERQMASMGVNVSDGGFAAAQAELQNQEALQAAAAANSAREGVKTVGRALRADVVGTGRGVVGAQGTQAAMTLNAGTQATSNAQVPVNVGQSGIQTVQAGAGQALSGLNTAANIYTNSSRMQADAAAAGSQAQSGLAGAAMTAAALF